MLDVSQHELIGVLVKFLTLTAPGDGLARFGCHAASRFRNSGIGGTSEPPPVGRQSEWMASLVDNCRLRGGPIGCGVKLSLAMRAASLGSTDATGIAIKAKLSAPRLARSSPRHDCGGRAIGERRT